MVGLSETSGLGMGCVKLGSAGAGGARAGVRLVHEALDKGIRLFDTADAYGDGASELVLGEALRKRREDVLIATKGGYHFSERSRVEWAIRRSAAPAIRRLSALTRHSSPAPPHRTQPPGTASYSVRDYSPAYLRGAVEGSLRRLGVEHIGLYQLHGPVDVCGDDVVALMQDLRTDGKIGAFGVGLETLDRAAEWLAVESLAAIQLPFGILDPEAGAQVIGTANIRGVHVIARSILAAGLLTNASAAATLLRPNQRSLLHEVQQLATESHIDLVGLAVRYVRDIPGVKSFIIGMSSTHHLDQALHHLSSEPLPARVSEGLSEAIGRYLATSSDRFPTDHA